MESANTATQESKSPDFEDYLNDVFMAEIGFQMLDDALADGFESWLEQQQLDDIIKWANEYAAKFRKEIA